MCPDINSKLIKIAKAHGYYVCEICQASTTNCIAYLHARAPLRYNISIKEILGHGLRVLYYQPKGKPSNSVTLESLDFESIKNKNRNKIWPFV